MNLYDLVPKELQANVRYRKRALEACRDEKARAAMREACRADILLWVNLWVWQVDPKQKGDRGKPGPFITYAFQDEALLRMLGWVRRGRDGLLEKSRQMGASWMLVMLFTWLWLFHEWQTFLFISRSEVAVESADPNSLFWKIDFLLSHLPDWMKPQGFRRRKRFFGNDDQHSSIFGEASTGKANVGGNTTAMGIDEFSQIDEDYEVLHRTSDSTQCRIFNGTHKGVSTAFFELTKNRSVPKLVLHWTQHPIYSQGLYRVENGRVVLLDSFRGRMPLGDEEHRFPEDWPFVTSGKPTGGPQPGIRSPWYDDQALRKGSLRAIAMDLDIDPAGSEEQFFDSLVILRLQEQYATLPFWEGDLRIDPDLARPKSFEPRLGGALRLWIHLSREGFPPLGVYVLGGDLSSGQGKTPSVLSIVNQMTGEKVGRWASNQVEPADLAPIAVALCWAFKGPGGDPAKLAWEVPGPGITFGKRVVGLGFRHIHYRESIDRLHPLASDIPGWVSNRATKLHLLQEYRDALKTHAFLNPSWEGLQECLSFVYTEDGAVEHSAEAGKDSPADARQNHGDETIADAIANMLRGNKRPVPQVQEQISLHPGTLQGRRALWEEQRRAAESEWL